jgi:hypothetical protein
MRSTAVYGCQSDLGRCWSEACPRKPDKEQFGSCVITEGVAALVLLSVSASRMLPPLPHQLTQPKDAHNREDKRRDANPDTEPDT